MKTMAKLVALFITAAALVVLAANTSTAQQNPGTQLAKDAPRDAVKVSLSETPEPFRQLVKTYERKDLPQLRGEITVNAVDNKGVVDLVYKVNGSATNVRTGLAFLDERKTVNLQFGGVDFRWELKCDSKCELLYGDVYRGSEKFGGKFYPK